MFNKKIRQRLKFHLQVPLYSITVFSTFSVLTRYIMYFHVCNNNTKRFPAFVYIWFRETTQHVEVVCSGKKEGGCYNQSHLSVNNVQKEAFPQKKYRTKTYFNLIYSRPIEIFCVVQISFMQIRTFQVFLEISRSKIEQKCFLQN